MPDANLLHKVDERLNFRDVLLTTYMKTKRPELETQHQQLLGRERGLVRG